MKLTCEIAIPASASKRQKLAAIAKAGSDLSMWKESSSIDEIMKKTDLKNKCGSCKYFISKPDLNSKCYGECAKGRHGYKQRSNRACTLYEERS